MTGRNVLLSPFLFALFPIISLYSKNSGGLAYGELLAPIVIATAATGVILAAATLLTRDTRPAAAIVSVFWLLFLSYGHVYLLISEGSVPALRFSEHGPLLLVWAAMLASFSILVLRVKRQWQFMSQALTVVGFAGLIMPAATIGISHLQQVQVSPDQPLGMIRPDATGNRPSIYYIILDSYARSDVLRDVYDYDNGWFIDELERRGFFVAKRATSNYSQTHLSLASSLNASYINDATAAIGRDSQDRTPVREMLSNNRVSEILRQSGYQYVTISSGFLDTELDDAGVHIVDPRSIGNLNSALLNLTPLVAVTNLQLNLHRDRVLYAFEHLADPAQMDQPVFVVAHVLAPHGPFVFADEGAAADPGGRFELREVDNRLGSESYVEGYIRGYRGQVASVSKRALDAVDEILASSSSPPVIILQSDHGPSALQGVEEPTPESLRERMAILNAVYSPGDSSLSSLQLDAGATPVNTFRAVFNLYFGASLPLLPDQIYFSTEARPYQFLDATGTLRQAD